MGKIKETNQRKALIAQKALELGMTNATPAIYREAAETGLNNPPMNPTFIRDFMMIYLESMNAKPKMGTYKIMFDWPTRDGIWQGGQNGKNQIFWYYRPDEERSVLINVLAVIRHFEFTGKIRADGDIEGRPIREGSLSILKAKLGTNWFNILRGKIEDLLYYDKEKLTANYHVIKPGLAIRFSGEEILVQADFKSVVYKNGTLTIPSNDIPETYLHGIGGKPLNSIIAGLPDDPCFSNALALKFTRSHKTVSIEFDDRKVPLKAA